MELPLWLNKQFLSAIFEQQSEGKVCLVSFTAQPATSPGNNYLSDVYRVRVEYRVSEDILRSDTIIVKAPTLTAFTTVLAEKIGFFNKEPKLYEKLFPKMSGKVNCECFPRYYPCPVDDLLVLQDLNEEGYFMSDRVKQLDYPHCLKVFTTVAKFHAASVAAYHEDPDAVRALGKEILYTLGGPVDDEVKSGIASSVRRVAEIVKDDEECKVFHDLLLKRVDHLVESCASTFSERRGKLNVLNHGDLWTTNIMFKHDAKEVTGVKLIDYQMTRLTSPVFDLVFFLWTSADTEVRERRQCDLYSAYLRTLNRTLEEADCEERMTAQDLQADLREAADFALIMICHMLPVFVADPEDGILKLDEINLADNPEGTESETSRRLFSGKYFRAILPTIARQFLHCFS